MTISRRLFVGSLAAASAGTLAPQRLFAADYPARPIQLVVPFAAGGNADIVGRIVGDQIGRGLNGTVVVENRGGAGGGIGAEFVAKATPDGYTLLVGSNGPLTVNPFIHAQARLRSADGFRADRAHELRAARADPEQRRRGQDRF